MRCHSEERRLLSHVTTYSIYTAHYYCMCLTFVVGNVCMVFFFLNYKAAPGSCTHPALCRSYWSGRSLCGPASRLRTGPLWSGWGWIGWREAPPGSTRLPWPCSSEDVLPWTSRANRIPASSPAPHMLCRGTRRANELKWRLTVCVPSKNKV